ncbi:extracellular solute-binding protein [Bdellovibrio sp. 22V]|uniref:extracellular solute-binding protein n=1 Tax=Bdellovibrio TaxID=958 RepID=UPI0025427514|nr:extracellular solute-binding protein [Bdellovibrio sp. 22V]WII73500.1 extracellular solute-binding protein [Bdellovibrio sp. 22V]
MKMLIAALLVSMTVVAQAETLTIYTDRPTARLQPIVDQFKADKGVEVVVVEKPYADIVAQLEAEGANSPADLIFTKDLVFLSDLTNKGLLQPLTSAAVKSRVAPAMKDANDHWVAVTYRARTLVYDSSRVNPSEISSYEDLANPKWAGRVCMRTSKGTYNVALIASFVHHKGETTAKNIVAGILENLAVDVYPNDTAMMTAMANGICDVGIANTYYLAGMVQQNPNFPVKVLFANQDSTGAHVNGSGIGIAKNSQNAALAQDFISLMLQEPAQLHLSSSHLEYPAAVGVTPNTLIKDWGTFKADATSWSVIGESVPAAVRIIKELDYK